MRRLIVVSVICALAGGLGGCGHLSDRGRDALDVSALEQISVGDSYEHVISVLGSPTYECEMMPKKRSISMGKALDYVAKQHEPGNLNAKVDCYVTIYFDEKGNVKNILKNNMD